jgi:uncharacterized protein YjbI with pentapeptide repeats
VLFNAELMYANLQAAKLEGADLSAAGVENADLRNATGLTLQQIRSVHSLKGATMPDGSVHD